MTWTGINIYRVECGRIAEVWSEVDALNRIAQLTGTAAERCRRPARRCRNRTPRQRLEPGLSAGRISWTLPARATTTSISEDVDPRFFAQSLATGAARKTSPRLGRAAKAAGSTPKLAASTLGGK